VEPVRSRLVWGAAALLAACANTAGRAEGPRARPRATEGELQVFVEGPCPKLSVEAAGDRRFLVYGDHGRVLAGWMPGDRVASAESIAELRGGRVFRRPSLLAGLPRDARGWVNGELTVGGTAADPWLVRTTVRYSLVHRGPLFERSPEGYRSSGERWEPSDEPVSVPKAARSLPMEFPHRELCSEELDFVPITWASTPEGGLVIAGRCDDDKAPNYTVTTLVAAIGSPGAQRWRATLLPGAERLSGIVNVSLAAASEKEIYATAWEPFREPAERQAYLVRFDGKTWQPIETGLRGGLLGVACDGRGGLWVTNGEALHRRHDSGFERVALPPLRFAAPDTRLHLHRVRAFDGELWVEGSYTLRRSDQRGVENASVLFGTRRADAPLFCDAKEEADLALYEAQP